MHMGLETKKREEEDERDGGEEGVEESGHTVNVTVRGIFSRRHVNKPSQLSVPNLTNDLS